MERVTQSDLPDVVRFLEARVEKAMFPLNNLHRYGLDADVPYGPRMWMTRDNSEVSGVLTYLTNGTVMPACPVDMTCAMLPGRNLLNLIGPANLVRPVIDRFGLNAKPFDLDQDEPHFALDLADMHIPEGPGELRPLEAADEGTILCWREAYLIEALGYSSERAQREAAIAYRAQISSGLYRVLFDGATPLCVTGFNAVLPQIVQIGGVYTPSTLRARGHARRAVALHLQEARAQGVSRATLFSASPAAQRAYEAIGFQRIGDWTIFLRPEAQRV